LVSVNPFLNVRFGRCGDVYNYNVYIKRYISVMLTKLKRYFNVGIAFMRRFRSSQETFE